MKIDFTQIALIAVDPNPATRPDLYSHLYETFRIEVRPSEGSVLTVARAVPAVYLAVMSLD